MGKPSLNSRQSLQHNDEYQWSEVRTPIHLYSNTGSLSLSFSLSLSRSLSRSLSLSFTLPFVVASSYIAFITDTIHSSTPRYLSAQGTLSKAFSESIKAIHRSFFFVSYFPCSWRILKKASVMLLPAINPIWILTTFTFFLTLSSMTFSKTFIAYFINVIPCMSHNPMHPLYLCRCLPTSSFSASSSIYHLSLQHYTHLSSSSFQPPQQLSACTDRSTDFWHPEIPTACIISEQQRVQGAINLFWNFFVINVNCANN